MEVEGRKAAVGQADGFAEVFGVDKETYIDGLLEMEPQQLSEECAKHKLPPVQEHIQNL